MENNDKKTADYSDEERYDRRRALIGALLRWLECEFFGFFVFLSMFALSPLLKTKGYVIFGILGIIIYAAILLDFGLKEGSRAGIKNSVRGDSVKPAFGLVLGLVSAAPALLSYGMLALSYSGVTGSMVLPFKLLNAGWWGIIHLFVKTMDIADMSAALMWVFPLLLLIYPLSVSAGFRAGISDEDIRTKIMYKKQ